MAVHYKEGAGVQSVHYTINEGVHTIPVIACPWKMTRPLSMAGWADFCHFEGLKSRWHLHLLLTKGAEYDPTRCTDSLIWIMWKAWLCSWKDFRLCSCRDPLSTNHILSILLHVPTGMGHLHYSVYTGTLWPERNGHGTKNTQVGCVYASFTFD